MILCFFLPILTLILDTQMACNPFEPWGGEGEEEELEKEEQEERRYCGLGDKKMIGFQCSCSS